MRTRHLLYCAALLWGTSAFAQVAPGDDVLIEAQESGLPTRALEAKRAEGLAKHVPDARLTPLLRQMLADLREAQSLLPDAPPQLLECAAQARHAGVEAEDLLSLAAMNRGIESIQIATELRYQGLSSTDATQLARTLDARADVKGSDLLLASQLALASGEAASAVSQHLGKALALGKPVLGTIPAANGGPPDHSKAGGNGNGNGNGKPPTE